MNIQNYQRFCCEQKDFGVFWLIESIWTIPGYPIFEDNSQIQTMSSNFRSPPTASGWERPRSLTTSTGSWKTSCPDAQTSTFCRLKPMGLRIAKYLSLYIYTVYIYTVYIYTVYIYIYIYIHTIYIYTLYISLPHIYPYMVIFTRNMTQTWYIHTISLEYMWWWNHEMCLSHSWYFCCLLHPDLWRHQSIQRLRMTRSRTKAIPGYWATSDMPRLLELKMTLLWDSLWRTSYFIFFSRQVLFFFLGSWFSAFMLFCFSCFSACLLCFSAFLLFLLLCLSTSLLFCFSAFLLLCLSTSLLFCFSAFLLLCLSTSLLFCFSAFLLLCFLLFLLFAFPASLPVMLLCFSGLPASFLFCFSAFLLLPFYFYCSTFFFFSHVFLLLYFLLLCFSASCLYCLLFFFLFFCFIFSCLYPKWNPNDPRWHPEKP